EQVAHAAGAPLDGALLAVREAPSFVSEVRAFPGGRLILTQLEPLEDEQAATMALARSMALVLAFEPRLLLFVTPGRQRVHPEAIYRLARASFRFQLYAYSLGDGLAPEVPGDALLTGAQDASG